MFPIAVYRYRNKKFLIYNLILKPIYEAYEKLIEDDDSVSENNENTISQKIVWYINNKTSISNLINRGTITLILRQKIPVTVDELYEPDIEFKLATRLFMEIEAKRIYEKNKWSIREYLDENGLDRFLEEKYSVNRDYAGMLGYVQKGNIEKVYEDCKTKIVGKSFIELSEIQTIRSCFFSRHNKVSGQEIQIYHLFLHFL